MSVDTRLRQVAVALRSEAETLALASHLAARGVPVLVLKGPALQARLYGTPAAYASGDVDVLVPRDKGRIARRTLEQAGWRFEEGNGVLWFVSRAASYERDGVRVDLHWGLHAAHLPARVLRRLEEALWRGASPGPDGLLHPDAESLLVFLAVHAAGHRFERPEWSENVERCRALVSDWPRVWRIAREARMERLLRAVLEDKRAALLDGTLGRAIWVGSRLLRGHLLPQALRDSVRRSIRRMRPRRLRRRFSGIELEIGEGVFAPRPVTEGLVRLALEAVAGRERPAVVDVGTGSGAVALAIAAACPEAEVHATDVSKEALRCARRNRRRLGLRNVRFHHGSLLESLPAALRGRTTAIVANLPYVPMEGDVVEHPLLPVGTFEGQGRDGLDLLRELARGASEVLEPGGWLTVQLASFQWKTFPSDLASMGYRPFPPDRIRPVGAAVGRARWIGGGG